MQIVRNILLVFLLTVTLGSNSYSQVTYSEIQLLIDNEKYKDALDLTEDHLSRNKSDVKFQFLKGLILTKLGRYDDAEKIYYRIAEQNPNLPEPLNNLAVIYAIQGKYSQAQDVLKKALSSNKNYETAYNNLSDIYAKAASHAYNQALGLEKGKADSKEKLLILSELNLPESEIIESLSSENLELKSVLKDIEKALNENKLAMKIKNQQLAKLGETQRSIQKLMQEKLELNMTIKELKGSLDEVMYSLTLKDEQLAKLEKTEKALASLSNTNKDLKDRLLRTEESLGQLNSSLVLKDEQLAKLDQGFNATVTNALKKENNNLKDKVKEREILLDELKKSVAAKEENENTNKLSEQKKAIELAINQWASAWSSKDVEGYISSYADDFKPSRGLSKNKWEKQRRERLANPAFIKITLVNLNIEINDNGFAKIRFKQEYKSDTYSDEVEKEITVMMFKDKWLITRERVR
ncbi:MAG: hypothetical protein CMF40_02550 [Legionellales bacterium]|nr:hypothetical protein [Legionellales bacterium]